MSSERVTVSIPEPRPRGLSEATNMRSKDYIDDAKHGDTYIQSHSYLPPTSAPCKSNAHINGLHKPESSKALLSDDWRQRAAGNAEPNFPHTITFSNCFPKLASKEDEKRKMKKLRVDTIAARSAGPSRRFRNQENSPIEPNLTLSAPATRDEFKYAADGSAVDENHEEKPNCPIKPLSRNSSLGPKYFVEMNSLHSPVSDGGYIYVSSSLTGISPVSATDSGTCSNISFGLATISENFFETPTISHSGNTSIGNMKQVAQLQQVKNLNDLKIKPWNQIHLDLLKPLSEEDQELHCRNSLLSAYDKNAQEQNDHSYIKSLSANRNDDVGYQRMLAKLHKNSLQDLQSTDTTRISIEPSHTSKPGGSSGMEFDEYPKEQLIKSPPAKVQYRNFPEKARTLNPKAPEFTAAEERKPATHHIGSAAKFVRPSVVGLFNQKMPTIQSNVADTMYQHLSGQPSMSHSHMNPGTNPRRVMIAAQLINHLAENSGTIPDSAELGLILELAGITDPYVASTSETPRQDVVTPISMGDPTATYIPFQNIGTPGICSGISAHSSISSARSGISQIAPLSMFVADNGPSVESAPSKHPLWLANIGPGALPMVPSSAPIDSITNAISKLPIIASNIQQLSQFVGKDFKGKEPSFSKENPFDTRNIGTKPSNQAGILPSGFFGPKPVSKPKGPPRPNDPRWNKQQQEYEAYLEWRRAFHPEYHQDCRDRQAKRADKQKLKEIKEQFKIPSKKNAAIKIKKPLETDAKD